MNFNRIYDPHRANMNEDETSEEESSSLSYVDFSADENGLWFLFGLASLDHTVVAIVDPSTMEPEFMWELTLNPHMLVSE